MRKQLMKAILAAGTVAAALSLGVPAAFAVTTFSVSGGTNFTSTAASGTTFTLTNGSNNFTCTVGSSAGTVTDQSHSTNTKIGTVTSASFGSSTTPCHGPFSSSGTAADNACGGAGQPACPVLNVSSFSSPTATGTITGIDNTLTVHNLPFSPNPCTIHVTGTAGVTYNNTTHVLAFTTANDNLSIVSSGTTCNFATGSVTFSSGSGGETVTGSPTNPVQVTSP
jgi:hypothetical protein